jgi:uncharacterized protein
MEQMALQVVTKHPQGNFSWADLMTTDVAAAKRFYGELFGWTYEDRPMGDGKSYTMASLHGHYVAGMMVIEEGMQMPPSWQSYIAVDNVDASAAKATTAGGTLLSPPMDVYSSGRMATLQDPSGAIVSLWQARDHIGAGYAMGPGIASWHELWTKDAKAALDFYSKLVGWTGTVNEGQNGQPYVSCNNGETPVAVILTLGPDMAGVPPHWAIYFGAVDVKASAARAQQLGGSVIVQPTEAGGFPFALLQDPQGAMFFVLGAQA